MRGDDVIYSLLKNFDHEHLIGREITIFRLTEESTESQPFAIISKKDGSMVNDIRIRFKSGKDAVIMSAPNSSGISVGSSPTLNSIISFNNNWILTEISSDTIYKLLPDFSMIPFLVRTPSIQSMNPEIFLNPDIFTDRFYFMRAIKKESGWPRAKLVYDRQDNTIFEYYLYNNDYVTEKVVNISLLGMMNNVNNEVAYWQKIETYQLVDAYKKGELKGKLKEIAANLGEEDNPVIMLIKHKK